MSGLPARVKDMLAIMASAGGLGLMILPWYMKSLLPSRFDLQIDLSVITLWVAAGIMTSLWGLSRAGHRKTACRYAVALSIFIIALLPADLKEYALGAQRIMAMLGLMLFVTGLACWPAAQPWIIRVRHAVRAVNAIPRRYFLGTLFLIFLSAALFLSWHCFSFLPAYDDSVVQYVNSRIIAGGKFYETHPLQIFFQTKLMHNTPQQWVSIYQPLHMSLMALGQLISAPWLLNPLEGALTVVALYYLARRVYDEPTARLAALLALFCPLILLMSSEYMNHASSLLFGTLFMLSYIAMLQTLPTQRHIALRWAFAAGLSLGLVFLVRPLTMAGIGLAFALYALHLLRRDWRMHLAPFCWMGVGMALCLAVQGWYDFHVTGGVFLLPYAKYHTRGLPGFSNVYTFPDALAKSQDEWTYMNLKLFEWFVPCTLFVLLACLLPLKNRYASLLLAMLFAFTLVNMTNRWAYHVFGPRYIYETCAGLVVLSAGGIRRIALLLRFWKVPFKGTWRIQGISAIAVIALVVTGWAGRMPGEVRYYANHFGNNYPDFYASMLKQSQKPAVIFIGQLPQIPGQRWEKNKKYLWVSFNNPPRDTDPVIFALDRGGRDIEFMKYYPHRHYYVERDGKLYPIEPQLQDVPLR